MKDLISKQVINTYIKIVVLSILIVLSYLIVKPFITIIIWSVLVAIALFPIYNKVIRLFKGKKKGLVTSLFIIILLALIITPTIRLTTSVISSSKELKENFEAGTLKIPPPAESVKEWPLIGEKTYDAWAAANRNIEGFVLTYKDQIGSLAGSMFNSFAGLMGSVFLALFSLIFAGVFMFYSESGYKTSVQIGDRLKDGKGEKTVAMVADTIRSVVKGILLVAIIQAGLAYLGFIVIGLPAAAFFALLVLIFAIIQLPPIIAMIPAIAIVFSTSETTPAIIFAIYCIIVGMSDGVMKPFLLGKGLQTPMLVILIGALGGMIFMGMLGLFIGPVILAIVYQMYNVWISEDNFSDEMDNVAEGS
jgi:predicted PurR-regulated permease PerM